MKKFISILSFISLFSLNSFAETKTDAVNEKASGSTQSALPESKETISTSTADVISKIDAKVGDITSLQSKAKPAVPARRAR